MATPVSPAIPTPASAGTPVEIALPPPPETLKSVPAVPEAASPPKSEGLSTKQEVNTALEEMGKVLFERKDENVGVVALARLAGQGEKTTPMGEELRNELVRALQKDKSAPESIKSLSVPEKQDKSAFNSFLVEHAKEIPTKEMPRLILKMGAGKLTIAELTNELQRYKAIREPLLNELLGENHPPVTHKDMLKSIHLETTPQNVKQMKDAFAPDKIIKFDKGRILSTGMTVGFWAIMLLQLGQSLANDSSSGHH